MDWGFRLMCLNELILEDGRKASNTKQNELPFATKNARLY